MRAHHLSALITIGGDDVWTLKDGTNSEECAHRRPRRLGEPRDWLCAWGTCGQFNSMCNLETCKRLLKADEKMQTNPNRPRGRKDVKYEPL